MKEVMDLVKKFHKFIIVCEEEIDSNLFNCFCSNVEKNFLDIETFFNIEHNQLELTLVSKNNLDNIVRSVSEQYKNKNVPYWLVGFSTFKKVWVTVPNTENVEELSKVALHELVHLISYKLDTQNKRLKLLDEGLAVFLSKQYDGKHYTPWINSYFKNNLPHISDFCTYDGIEFANKKGYYYSYCIVDFLINSYGKYKVLEWLQNPNEFCKELTKLDEVFEKYILNKIEARIK